MNPLDTLMKVLFDNILLVVIGVFGLYLALLYLRMKSKTKYTVIDRRKIEKANFIEEMKYNIATKYKYLFKGKQLIGKITHYAEGIVTVAVPVTIKAKIGNPEPKTITKNVKQDIKVLRIVFRPTFKNIPFVKPFSKPEALMLEDDSLSIIKMPTRKHIYISDERSINYYFGIYFDEKDAENIHSPNIINTRVLKTDVEQLASRYFTKSQEQCVYSPEMAHQFALKERELAIELAKAKGKRESI